MTVGQKKGQVIKASAFPIVEENFAYHLLSVV